VVADKEGPEIFAPAFRERIIADNEFLRFGNLEFDPSPAAFDRFRRMNLVFWRPAPSRPNS
jgi:hypothetical protein